MAWPPGPLPRVRGGLAAVANAARMNVRIYRDFACRISSARAVLAHPTTVVFLNMISPRHQSNANDEHPRSDITHPLQTDGRHLACLLVGISFVSIFLLGLDSSGTLLLGLLGSLLVGSVLCLLLRRGGGS